MDKPKFKEEVKVKRIITTVAIVLVIALAAIIVTNVIGNKTNEEVQIHYKHMDQFQ